MMAALVTAMTLGELIGAAAGSAQAVEIVDITLDSRAVTAGSAFVALAGGRDHGLNHADEAVRRGAVAVLFDPQDRAAASGVPGAVAVPALRARLGELAARFFWRDRPQPALYGVTGTNGKTTVAWLVAQALGRLGKDCGYVGTLGFGRPGALAPHSLTTPDCLTLHRELAGLGAAAAALEVSSHGLVQDRVAGLEFSATAVTNLTRDHLDAHGTMDDYARAKARIVDLPGVQTVVLNVDDAFAAGLGERCPAGVRPLRVTRHAGTAGVRADLRGRLEARGFDGLELELEYGAARATLASSLIGEFNGENLLVAAGLVIAAGFDLEPASQALSQCGAAPGRLEVFRHGEGPAVVVDYAHTPDALARTLDVLAALGDGQLVCVFGCGGERDAGKRPLMGSAASRATRVVLTDDNPRGEDPAAIVAEIRAGLRPGQPVSVDHDRARAIRSAIAGAGAGDVVLVAGKGHETEQLTDGERRPFDDRAVVRAAIGAAS